MGERLLKKINDCRSETQWALRSSDCKLSPLRLNDLVTWLQATLQFKMQLPNLNQPSLVERIDFLPGNSRS